MFAETEAWHRFSIKLRLVVWTGLTVVAIVGLSSGVSTFVVDYTKLSKIGRSNILNDTIYASIHTCLIMDRCQFFA